jgi:hypothetical protein
MRSSLEKRFYLVVAEFSTHRTGLVIYHGADLLEADTLLDYTMEEMEAYSLAETLGFPFRLKKKYIKYQFTGEEYCPGSVHYRIERTISNGDLSLLLIASDKHINVDHFLWYRNLPIYWGFGMN